MDHLVPWLIVAVIVFGWLRRAVRGTGRAAAAVTERAASEAAARARVLAAPAADVPRAKPSVPMGTPRTTAPTRRVPLSTPRDAGLGPAAEPSPASGPGAAVVAALGHGPSLRTAVVVAELLAPPVALR